MQHIRSAAPSTQNDDGGRQSSAPATKNATHLLKTTQKYCACHTKPLSTSYETRLNVTKCHACHAKRSNATCETSKMTPSAKLTIGTASRGRLRTVANVNATSSEHTLSPQSETGTLATHSGQNTGGKRSPGLGVSSFEASAGRATISNRFHN